MIPMTVVMILMEDDFLMTVVVILMEDIPMTVVVILMEDDSNDCGDDSDACLRAHNQHFQRQSPPTSFCWFRLPPKQIYHRRINNHEAFDISRQMILIVFNLPKATTFKCFKVPPYRILWPPKPRWRHLSFQLKT